MSADVSKNVPTKRQAGERQGDLLPRVINDPAAMCRAVRAAQKEGRTVGLVPTMGALHEGHLSLVDTSRSECNLTVTTIFVNPTQFAPHEDFRQYPRSFDADLSLLGQRGCDLVFAPSTQDMYPPGYATSVDVGPISQPLEGEFRPGHFRGVATVVLKLFEIVPADRAYFGRKDYQQTLVVRQMVRDLNVPIDIRVCPTVRESDGLAMSSRNAYLNADERGRALALSRSLSLAERLVEAGERNVATIRQQMQQTMDQVGGVELQYIAFVADGTVTPVDQISGPTIIVLAAKIGKTRLIDNILVSN